MTTGSSDGVTVVFETTATEDEIRAVKDTLAEFNLQWPIATDAEPEPRGGIGDIPPLVQFVAVYGIARFFDAFLAEAGKSAYQRFSEFLARLRARRWPRRYEIRIRDEDTGHVIAMPDDPPAEALAALEAIDFNAQDRPVIATLSHDDACRLAWVLHTAEVDGSDVLSADAAIRQARYRITWSKRGERAEEEPLTVVAHLFRAELDFVAFYMRAGEWDSPTLIIRASDVREIRELSDDD